MSFASDRRDREVSVHLLVRRLYETMLYWETADQDPSLDDAELEWAALWKPLPKVVFSTTLSAVQGTARLASGGLAQEIERLRAEPGEGDIAIGGATLAAEAAALGLIDEYRAMVYPVLSAVAFRLSSARAPVISNSSRPAPSARASSTRLTGSAVGPILVIVQAMPAQGPSIQRHAPRAAPPPGLPGRSIRRATTIAWTESAPIPRTGQERYSPDMMSRNSPARRHRRASLARRAGRRCAAPAAAPCRRPAPLLRHERLSDDPRPRRPHGRRGLPDLRLRAPGRLTRVTSAPAPRAATRRPARPSCAGRARRPWTDRG